MSSKRNKGKKRKANQSPPPRNQSKTVSNKTTPTKSPSGILDTIKNTIAFIGRLWRGISVVWKIIALIVGAYTFYQSNFKDPKIEVINDDTDPSLAMAVPFILTKSSNLNVENVKWECNITAKIDTGFGKISLDKSLLASGNLYNIEPYKKLDCDIGRAIKFPGNYILSSACLIINVNYNFSFLGFLLGGERNYSGDFKWNNVTKKWVEKCENPVF
ncbi:MAG: hypothetical protein AABY33_06445 [Pseudomonadota bacterium]